MAQRRALLQLQLAQAGHRVNIIVAALACMTLHNLMRHRYQDLQNADLDREDDQHRLIPGAWRDAGVMQEVEQEGRGPRQTADGKRQRAYLKRYFNSPAGSVPWQDAAIDV